MKNLLTKREREVWEIYSECKDPIWSLAELLTISENTFNIHLKSIRRKMNAVDSRDVVRIYYEEKINQIKNPPVTPDPAPVLLPLTQGAKVIRISFTKSLLEKAA